MATTATQTSSNPFSEPRERRKTHVIDKPKKEIWSTLLNSVSSGKRLPEKQLLLLGGTPETQKDFLESLSAESSASSSRSRQQTRKPPPVANQYALGYTYQDVLDGEHEDVLARLSVYTLASPSPAFAPLLKPLLTPQSLPNTLIILLLDWSHPWLWTRQLLAWIRLLRSLVVSLDDESKNAMEANIGHLMDGTRLGSNTVTASEEEGVLPLGPGEWDEPLGLPMCIVCLKADEMQKLEREHGWKDEQFDYIGQYIRTILLKHGGSLIYTMPSSPSAQLQNLVHSGLGIQSLAGGKKETGNAYEVSRREGTLVPMNWDSWAKIRMMADNFDPEDISKTWSEDIRLPTPETSSETVSPTSVTTYESLITNPKSTAAKPAQPSGTIEIDSKPVQDFLGEQSKILEEFQIGDRKERVAQDAKKDANRSQQSLLVGDESNRHVEEHIGPVQFNVGGIQVDAEEMVRGIKDREATRSGADDLSRREREVKSPGAKAGGGGESAEVENQRLKDFFTNLAKKSGGSAVNSPRRGVGGE